MVRVLLGDAAKGFEECCPALEGRLLVAISFVEGVRYLLEQQVKRFFGGSHTVGMPNDVTR